MGPQSSGKSKFLKIMLLRQQVGQGVATSKPESGSKQAGERQPAREQRSSLAGMWKEELYYNKMMVLFYPSMDREE